MLEEIETQPNDS